MNLDEVAVQRLVVEAAGLADRQHPFDEALAGVSPSSTSVPQATRPQVRAAKSTRKTNGTSTGGRRGRPKGSGKRADEALALVTAQPGITIPQIAKRIGIKQNYLYRVMPNLAKEGQVKKDGPGWYPAESA